MKNYFDLKDQVAIVTGCSTGLGVQMAKALANQGANIVVVARRQELIDQVAKEIADEKLAKLDYYTMKDKNENSDDESSENDGGGDDSGDSDGSDE